MRVKNLILFNIFTEEVIMALAINNNLMSNNVTRNLQTHYGKLNKSTQRLSSGLRVSSASDDAAGLAIRELMRADIAALGQGVRNANDGVSMIQTADGALGVIDAKLIRMKELAEQASSGTYTDVQRKMINKEYQLMADEITRIASDTDFNGRKLLAGSGQETKVEQSVAQNGGSREANTVSTYGNTETWRNQQLKNEAVTESTHVKKSGPSDKNGIQTVTSDGTIDTLTYKSRSGLATVVNSMKAAIDTGTIDTKTGEIKDIDLSATGSTMAAASNVYKGANVIIETRTSGGEWKDITATITAAGTATATAGDEVRITVESNDGELLRDTFTNTSSKFTLKKAAPNHFTIETATASTTAIQVHSEVAATKAFEHTAQSGLTVTTDAVTHFEDNSASVAGAKAEFTHNIKTGKITDIKSVESELKNTYGTEKKPVQDYKIEVFNDETNTWDEVVLGEKTGSTVDIMDDANKFRITAEYADGQKTRDTISNNTGGRFTLTKTNNGLSIGMKSGSEAQKSSTQLEVKSEDLVTVSLHFGTSSQETDSYDAEINTATAKSLGVGQEAGDNIETQENARKALENITVAISKKDEIRAQLGSTQNRLTATIENISIQKENLQAAESRISDVDVATEMTEFNKQQILANAAVSMLSQANNLPKMAQKLLG
jgi:flagellin-like hook-associated protein FlgL